MSPRARRRRRMTRQTLAAALALALLPFTVAAAEPAADAACAAAVAERVQRRYDAVRDLRARFVQRTTSVALGSAAADSLESRGEVVFAKPGRMRWSYESPEPSLVVSDGATVWIHDPAAREAQELPLGPDFLSGAAIQFLLGDGRLVEEFEVDARGCGAPLVQLLLTPRRDSSYERLELRADAKSGEIRSTVVVDVLGNRTEVELSDVRVNTGPAASLFRFEPPEGTRVLSVPPAR
jgi:outer membrane lipoprotein carrier protein